MIAFRGFLPLWITIAGSLALLLVEVLAREAGRKAVPWLAMTTVTAALASDLYLLWSSAGPPGPLFSGAVVVDVLTLFSGAAILSSAWVGTAFADSFLRREKAVTGEYYSLLLMAVSGALVLSASNDLITLFVGLELLSLPAYILAGYLRGKPTSVEAALKYFLPGVFASALLLYGSALLYGASGSVTFEGIRIAFVSAGAPAVLLAAGAALVMGAFAFKVAAAPFQAWAPDVYEGAPAPASAFLATAIKVAAFTAWVRFFRDIMPPGWNDGGALGFLALVTMAVGNFGALAQNSVKRMLAYSSVAHAGYVLVAVDRGGGDGKAAVGSAGTGETAKAISFYLLAYTWMTAGAFGWLAGSTGPGEKLVTFADFEGYGRRHPMEAAVMTLFLFSLAGLPPTAGFFGKYLVFKLAVEQGHVLLALAAVLFSLLSFAYYLRLMMAMYMKAPKEESDFQRVDGVSPGFLHRFGLGLCAAGTLLSGFLHLPF